MRLLIDIAIALAIAVAVGASTAWYAVDRGRIFGAMTIGQWTAWPRSGTPDADPYSAAVLARSGEVPLGSGEGLSFVADTDGEGQFLTGHCDYLLIGQTPPARLWTLTVYDGNGQLMSNPSERTGFHSREILRRPDGSFEILVSEQVAPGNWLPVKPAERLRLIFRLYDTQLAAGTDIGELTMPRIVRGQCR